MLDDDNSEKVKNGNKAIRRDIAEAQWKHCAEKPYLSGIFIWTGIDYRGEPTPLEWPAVYSQFGALDYCCFPKDNFYYYKSWWGSEDVLHIFPHWSFPGMEGEKITMHCYSNLEEVELFVNGISQGKQVVERNGYLSWKGITYVPGVVTAKGYRAGKVAMEREIQTVGEASQIVLEYFHGILVNDDTVVINCSITDPEGNVVPTADDELHFSVSGGQFIGCANGNPGDHSPEDIPVKRAFGGKCQLVVRTADLEKLVVEVKAKGLKMG